MGFLGLFGRAHFEKQLGIYWPKPFTNPGKFYVDPYFLHPAVGSRRGAPSQHTLVFDIDDEEDHKEDDEDENEDEDEFEGDKG